MFDAKEIERRIRAALPDATVKVQDLTGGMDHYAVEVVSRSFAGKTSIQRHRLVYAQFGDVIGGALHALQLSTKVPGE